MFVVVGFGIDGAVGSVEGALVTFDGVGAAVEVEVEVVVSVVKGAVVDDDGGASVWPVGFGVPVLAPRDGELEGSRSTALASATCAGS